MGENAPFLMNEFPPERIRKIIKSSGKMLPEFAQSKHVSRSTVVMWGNGTRSPNHEHILRLRRFARHSEKSE